MLYLGEINDTQQAAWRNTLAVFDEDQEDYRKLSLFPEDRPLPADGRGPSVIAGWPPKFGGSRA